MRERQFFDLGTHEQFDTVSPSIEIIMIPLALQHAAVFSHAIGDSFGEFGARVRW